MIVKYLVERALLLIPVLIGISLVVFLLIHLTPGDPAMLILGESYTPELGAQLRSELGLDDPLPTQYVRWLGRVVTGDMGNSLYSSEPVLDLIVRRGKITGLIAVLTIVFSVAVSVPLGVVSATNRDSFLDNVSRAVAMIGVSTPVFWMAMLFMLLFSVKLRWLPPGGSPAEFGWKALIMPCLALGMMYAAIITRMTRSTMLDVLRQDYIRTARAKGLGGFIIHYKHALKNVMIPVSTVIGLQLGSLLGGTVLTEYVFNLPGFGSLLVDSIYRRDFPVIQGAVLVTGVIFVLTNLVVDILYVFLDPRIRY